jgi:hypothetical protein
LSFNFGEIHIILPVDKVDLERGDAMLNTSLGAPSYHAYICRTMGLELKRLTCRLRNLQDVANTNWPGQPGVGLLGQATRTSGACGTPMVSQNEFIHIYM